MRQGGDAGGGYDLHRFFGADAADKGKGKGKDKGLALPAVEVVDPIEVHDDVAEEIAEGPLVLGPAPPPSSPAADAAPSPFIGPRPPPSPPAADAVAPEGPQRGAAGPEAAADASEGVAEGSAELEGAA